MLEITHHKARALLHAAADQLLDAEEKTALGAHLAQCKDCSAYARSLTGLETRLHESLHAQWDRQRLDLNLQAIIHPSPAKLVWNNFLIRANAMGKVGILAALLLGYVLLANLLGIKLPISVDGTPITVPTPSDLSLSLAASPTPSAQFTLTGLSTQACETVTYVVQANDTLEYIALQHGTTKEAIQEYNREYDILLSNTVFTGMELVIPLCKSTPSQVATTAITPLSGTIFPIQPE